MLETATRKKFDDDLKKTKIKLSDQEIYEKLRKNLLQYSYLKIIDFKMKWPI